jgi:hypothetical protein
MNSNAQQPIPRQHLHGLLKALRHVLRDNDFKVAQRLRSMLGGVKKHVEEPFRDDLEDLFKISGQWVWNVGNRRDNKRLIKQSIRRILARL